MAAAVFTILNIIADAFASSIESENKELFRVIDTCFTAISDKLLDNGILPSSKKLVEYFLLLRVYFKAFLSSLD